MSPGSGIAAQAGTVRAGRLERCFDALADAPDDRSAVEAVEALRAALWGELLAALHAPRADEVAELADRVAELCAKLLAARLQRPPEQQPRHSSRPPGAQAREDAGAAAARRAAADDAPAALDARALILDERPAAHGESPVPAGARARAPVGEIAIRDERAASGSAPWIAAIAGELRRYERDRVPFAVLLLEIRDLERLQRALSAPTLERRCAEVERALLATSSAARSAAAPIAQRPGRWWLTVPIADHGAARMLAEHLERTLASSAGLAEGMPGVLVGVAVCPENARTAPALAAHADVDLYAARAGSPI